MIIKFLANIYIHLFTSKKLFFTLIFSWILIISFTYIVLPPATDDMFYFWPALNFLYEKRIGMYEGDSFVTTYFQFPIYSLINGYFLIITNLFDIQLSSFSYKLFSKILLVIVFGLSLFWIKINSEQKMFYLKSNIFLILITFTPFSLGLIGSTRPEFLGIILVLLSIIIFTIEKNLHFKNFFKIGLAGLFLGLAFIVHPQFFTITSAAALIMVFELYFKFKRLKLIFIFSFSFILPVIFLFYWYYLGYPLSLDFLLNRTNYIGESPFIIFKINIINLIKQSIFLTNSSIYIKFYQSIFTLPYLFLLMIVFPITFFLFKKKKFLFDQKITFFIFIFSLLNFAYIKTYDYYNGVIAFFLLLFFCSIFTKNQLFKNIHKSSQLNLINFFCILIFIINSFFIITHTTKFLLSNQKYFNYSDTKNAVSPYLDNDTTLILTSEKLFGVFIKNFENNYSQENHNKTYMLFPFPDAGPTKNQLINAKVFLNTKLKSLKTKNLIFGAKKITSNLNKNKKEIILFFDKNLSLFINYNKIIYEDKDHIFFIPKKIQ
jgi:hypothetical protein